MQQRCVALISGANRGIGEAIARQLAGNGWRVSLGMRTPRSLTTREASQMTAPADLGLLINTLLDLPNEELNINCQLDDSY